MTRAVPCDGCTACCRNENLPLMPGDDPKAYKTQWAQHPRGAVVRILKRKPNGDCHYLGPDGCTIHDRRPYACRRLDCRILVAAFGGPAEQQAAVMAGRLKAGVLEAARRLTAAT